MDDLDFDLSSFGGTTDYSSGADYSLNSGTSNFGNGLYGAVDDTAYTPGNVDYGLDSAGSGPGLETPTYPVDPYDPNYQGADYSLGGDTDAGYGLSTNDGVNLSDVDGSGGISGPGNSGQQKDQYGNIFNKLGQLIKQNAGLIGTVLTPLVAPALSNYMSGGLINEGRDLLRGSGGAFSGINAPDLNSVIPQLQKQVQQGTMTAAQAQAVLANIQGKMEAAQAVAQRQADSGMGQVQTDAQSLAGQREGLGQLKDIATQQGLTEADRGKFASLMNQSNANAASQRGAQIQQLQMQGNAGSGNELAARLSGLQQGANANAAAGADIAHQGQARALSAIQSGIQGNANLNQQQFAQQAAKAQAQDAVNQFNTSAANTIGLNNSQLMQNANLANFNMNNQFALANQQAQNSANLANAGYQQGANQANFNMSNQIAGKNTDIANQQAQYPWMAAQQNFQNQTALAKAKAGTQLAAGNAIGQLGVNQLQRTGSMVGNATNQAIGGNSSKPEDNIFGNLIGGVGDFFSDERLKTDKEQLSDDEVDNMMANLTGYKYRYKGNKDNPQVAGVMAQDMQGDSVIDTPAGKMVQGPQALSQALAVIANQHARIRKLEGK
jgi:hypothetical protein